MPTNTYIIIIQREAENMSMECVLYVRVAVANDDSFDGLADA